MTQKGFNTKEINKTNWVYLYNLPYEITDEEAVHNEISSSFMRFIGPIKNIKFFSFKNYLDFKPKKLMIPTLESFENIFDPISIIKTEEENSFALITQENRLPAPLTQGKL